jgi:hypothetical protein
MLYKTIAAKIEYINTSASFIANWNTRNMLGSEDELSVSEI